MKRLQKKMDGDKSIILPRLNVSSSLKRLANYVHSCSALQEQFKIMTLVMAGGGAMHTQMDGWPTQSHP